MVNVIRIEIMPDYERAESAGVSPSFQIANINGYFENDEEIDLSDFIDQGYFYKDENQILKDLKENCREYSFINCEIEVVA